MARHGFKTKGLVAVVVGVCLSAALLPVASYAEGTSSIPPNDSYDYPEGSTEAELSVQSSYPSWFDLRHVGGTRTGAGEYAGGTSYVTSVKLQNPWGTCWAFGATAASEESILNEMGVSSTDLDLDLSELHLAWMSHTPLQIGSDQDGEGWILPDDFDSLSNAEKGDWVLDGGGGASVASSVYASGAGPVLESVAPYKGVGSTKDTSKGGGIWFWSKDGDWSVDQSLRFTQTIPLEQSCILPSAYGTVDAQTGTVTLNQSGIDAMKDELSQGRAVEIGYCAGIDARDDVTNTQTWASYAYPVKYAGYGYMGSLANHAVCVVGWDDDYPKENFAQGTTSDGASMSPPGDGAWIVKNSWGSSTEEAPNYSTWGDDGYFYLSYYDTSIAGAESFDYDVSSLEGEASDEDYSLVDEYDFMESYIRSFDADDTTSMANVFTADERTSLEAVSSETTTPGSAVRYQVFLLGDDAADPVDGTRVADFTKSYTYGGYHREPLPMSVTLEKGQRYAVVETVTYEGTHKLFYKEAGTAIRGIVNKGESYVCQNGQWVDYTDVIDSFKKTAGYAASYDNLPIKVFGNPLADEKPSITTESLAGATQGTAYDVTLVATGTAPITWSVSAGALPDGLTLDGTTGRITGTPTKAGTFAFTVAATNGGGSASKEYTVVVAAAAATTPATPVTPVVHGGTADTGGAATTEVATGAVLQASSVTKVGTPYTADEGTSAAPCALGAVVLLGLAVVVRKVAA
ncbi:MAG: lectin like domain-containing protein [Atopobiaceae bacterium]|jgi:hypothetical protein|nr:lectin like domain-containing protein [Atopobiaceae bacterium]